MNTVWPSSLLSPLLLRWLRGGASIQSCSNQEPVVLPGLGLERIASEAVTGVGGVVGGGVGHDLLDDLRRRQTGAGTGRDTEGDVTGDVGRGETRPGTNAVVPAKGGLKDADTGRGDGM